MRIPIDHVQVTSGIDVGELNVLSGSRGSDHFPVFCRWEVR
jgi:endonuclease/exonuclease/phosphatase (EEP) superfamily protein YafD